MWADTSNALQAAQLQAASQEADDLRAALGDQAQRVGMSSGQVLVELTRMRRALTAQSEKCEELSR